MGHESGDRAPKPGWGAGRLVFRRPEARNSEIAKANIIHSEQESLDLDQTLAAAVMRRRALTIGEREQQLGQLAALEAEFAPSPETQPGA